MKVIYFFVSQIIIQVHCQFLSILQELDMRNPIIVGDNKELKMDKMVHLMKSIMKQNQSVWITSNLNNGSMKESPGIILRQNVPDTFYEIPMNLHKPWVIVGKEIERYSQINQPLYFLENGTVYEQFECKSMKIKVRIFQKLLFMVSLLLNITANCLQN
jgi:hypothetical protein